MIKISTKGRYALRVMTQLAILEQHRKGQINEKTAISKRGDIYISLREISEKEDIPVKYLEQIIPLLSRAGLVKSLRGSEGGYALSKKISEYTVAEIICAAEGNITPVACLDTELNNCERNAYCVTLSVWQGLKQVIEEYLESITLSNIIEGTAEQSDYYFI